MFCMMSSSILSKAQLLLVLLILMILIGHVLSTKLELIMSFPRVTLTSSIFPSLILPGVQLRWHLRCRGRFWLIPRMTSLLQSPPHPHRLNLDLLDLLHCQPLTRPPLLIPVPLPHNLVILVLCLLQVRPYLQTQYTLLSLVGPTASDVLTPATLGLTLSTLHHTMSFVHTLI